MGKFKKGDSVRVIDNGGSPRNFYIGEVCKVASVKADGYMELVGKTSGMYDYRFELVEQPWQPKVGDRVRCVKDYYGSFTSGNEYTVAYFEPAEPRLGVTADDKGRPNGIGAEYFGPLHVAAQHAAVAVAASNDNAAPTKFKVGDRVVALHSSSNYVTAGKEYALVGVSSDGSHVNFINNHGGYDGWYASNFELATQPTASVAAPARVNPAIVCLIEDSQPKPATRPFVHPSTHSATKEAERLALLHPGQEFGVYVLAGSKIADEVITKTAVLRAA